MTKPLVKIHNVQDNSEIIREMNDEELAQLAIDQANAEKAKQAELEAKAKKETALAKLEALGLTTDDLKALGLGG